MDGRLLIVDDSATDRLIIKNMLSEYEVFTAENGLEAMRMLDKHPEVELIILDLHMPVMNGFEMLEALKEIDQKKRLRAIILTNYDEMGNEIRGLEAGAVDFIRKPINLESLRLRINIHLELLRIQNLYEQTLYERNLTLDTLLEQAPIGIALSHGQNPGSDNDERVIFNSAYERITGRTRDELIKLGWAQITHPDDLEKERELFREFQTGNSDGYSIEKRYVRPDGSVVWADVHVTQLKLKKNMEYDHICIVQNITERKQVEDALCESERSKSVLLSNLPGLAYRCDHDPESTMNFISEGCVGLTGYRPESLMDNRDLSYRDLIVPEYREPLWREWQRVLRNREPFKREYEITVADGSRKWVLEMGQGVFDDQGNVQAREGIIIDISDRKTQELQLKHISEIDSLTKLHNRRFLEDILVRDVEAKAEGVRAVVLISLRKLNSINLMYGYNFCEQIILRLVESLSGLANEHRRLFQVSFERFAFYITKYRNAAELERFSQSIIDRVDAIQILRTVGCGIGILVFHCRDIIAETIIQNASSAAEQSDKDQIYGYRFFNLDMENALKRDAEVKEALIRMVDGSPDDRLYLQFQPILNLKTNKVEEFEALARFESKKLGKVSPLEFIPIAEETQMINPLGKSVLEMACAFQKRLQKQGYADIRIFVNVSAIQLLRSDFLSEFLGVLDAYGLKPESFGLEVTESVFAGSFKAINDKLETLMEIGVKTSIDDFGTGYSTLARERDMKINVLKIDKSFIDGLLTVKPEQMITRDIIAMAHRLGHSVVAEGVEHKEQKQYLLDHQCDMMQGYLFSKPLDEDDAIRLLTAQTSEKPTGGKR